MNMYGSGIHMRVLLKLFSKLVFDNLLKVRLQFWMWPKKLSAGHVVAVGSECEALAKGSAFAEQSFFTAAFMSVADESLRACRTVYCFAIIVNGRVRHI